MDKHQLRRLITRTLERLAEHDDRLATDSAVVLLMGTAAQESRLGLYLYQVGGGPALGIYQMEPATEADIWDNYLWRHPGLTWAMQELFRIATPSPWVLETDLAYQTAMARLHYLRVRDPLPDADDLAGQARYWKRYWNTPAGKGNEWQYIENFNELCM